MSVPVSIPLKSRLNAMYRVILRACDVTTFLHQPKQLHQKNCISALHLDMVPESKICTMQFSSVTSV